MKDLKYRRQYHVTHSRDGFRLRIEDEHVAYSLAEFGMETFLGALGEPCCGTGPLAQLKISYRTLRRFGIRFGELDQDDIDAGEELDLDEDAMDLFWFRVLNLPGRLYRLNHMVMEIPLTDDQAVTLRPDVSTWFTDGPLDDEDDRVYTDCCLTGKSLGGGWHSYGCENFQGHSLKQ